MKLVSNFSCNQRFDAVNCNILANCPQCQIDNFDHQDNRATDRTRTEVVPVARHPYKIISPSLFNTRPVPESGRVPPLVRLPYCHRIFFFKS